MCVYLRFEWNEIELLKKVLTEKKTTLANEIHDYEICENTDPGVLKSKLATLNQDQEIIRQLLGKCGAPSFSGNILD